LERARQLAAKRGLAVTGSELVGMIPLDALAEAGRFYLARQGRSLDVPTIEILEAAVEAMGLSDVRPFGMNRQVLGLHP
jgi:glutamate formiminotransferase/formiminotetrahydrofolate cyclodeaminase